MIKRPLHDPIVSTHSLFVVNIGLYLLSGFFILGVVLFINTLCSFLYHLSQESNKFWQKSDHIFCIISLAFIFDHLFALATPKEIIMMMLWLLLSLVVYRAGRINYTVFHTLWHGCVFLGNVLVWACLV